MSTLFLIILYFLYLALDPVWIGINCLVLLIRNPKIVTSSIRNVLRNINNVLDKHLTRLESKLTATECVTTRDPDTNDSAPEPEDPFETARRERHIRQTRLATMKAGLQAHVRKRRHEKRLNEARRLSQLKKHRAQVVQTLKLAYAARKRAEKRNEKLQARALKSRAREARRNAKLERHRAATIRKQAREARKKKGNDLDSVSGNYSSDARYVA
ncbi:hypothetical protein N7450_004359 [Penicillium hetheringtonii]|uniref:Uncharacterized protein n=1 Tax=Penicillium hetheringtonii TaxID=911720 RepID=A0AAD6GV16_9EURO|nr:hypothetical protein N7450_004359 [Penicillium hetheringtonii]